MTTNAHWRDRTPLHMQDQVEAAEAEVQRSLWLAADALHVPVKLHVRDGSDPVMDRMLAQLQAAVPARELWFCPHAHVPQPLFLAWWRRPWTVLCRRCNGCAALPSELEDNTCDNCGHVDPEGTWPAHVALGGVVVSIGRCDSCAPITTRPEAPPRD